jgi:hypothetical protein
MIKIITGWFLPGLRLRYEWITSCVYSSITFYWCRGWWIGW